MANILIYAEHSHGKLPKAVAVAVSAAKEISAKHGGGDLILAVLGAGVGDVAKAAAGLGASAAVLRELEVAHRALITSHFDRELKSVRVVQALGRQTS